MIIGRAVLTSSAIAASRSLMVMRGLPGQHAMIVLQALPPRHSVRRHHERDSGRAWPNSASR